MGKYSTTAFFTHSLTDHSLPWGLATRSSPLSSRAMTSRIASCVAGSLRRVRSFQAFSTVFFKASIVCLSFHYKKGDPLAGKADEVARGNLIVTIIFQENSGRADGGGQ